MVDSDLGFSIILCVIAFVAVVASEIIMSQKNKSVKMKTLVSAIASWLKGAAASEIQKLLTYFQAILAALQKGVGLSDVPPPTTGSRLIDTLDVILPLLLELLPVGAVEKEISAIVNLIATYAPEVVSVLDTLILVDSATASKLITAGTAIEAPAAAKAVIAPVKSATITDDRARPL